MPKKLRKKTPRVKSKSTAQQWEALLCGAHAEEKGYEPQDSVSEYYNSLHPQWKDYTKELLRSSVLYNEGKLRWSGKFQGNVSSVWTTTYKKYSKKTPNGTSKCDVYNGNSSKRYSLKKYSGPTQLSSPQKAEAATLLHVSTDSVLRNKKSEVLSTLETVVDAMTDQKYYYSSIEGVVKALLPWYNSLPQELTPLVQGRGISSANFKELYPVIKKEAQKQTKHVVNRVLSIFNQKEKQKRATSALNKLFNNTKVKEAFLYELLSGEVKFEDKNATATHYVQLDLKNKVLKVEELQSFVSNNVSNVSFELGFRPSSKLVTLLRIYLGRKSKKENLYDSLLYNAHSGLQLLVEETSEEVTRHVMQEGLGQYFSTALSYVTSNPLVQKLTSYFTSLVKKLKELLHSLLSELVESGRNYVTKLCNVFGLSLDYSNSDYVVPSNLVYLL